MKIIFEFSGGPFDGRTVCGDDAEHHEVGLHSAGRYYHLTKNGTVGARFQTLSDLAFENLPRLNRESGAAAHIYEVREREVIDGTVYVRAKYENPRSAPDRAADSR